MSDFSNVPDAAIDAPETTPPMIVSSVPENMQAQVSVLTPISLFFDRRLDPASVTPMTVRLRYTYGYGWMYQYAKVAYDEAARKISLVPTVPMYHGYRYEVRVDGVQDLAGNTLSDGSVVFLTYVNSQKRVARYNTDGSINYVYRYMTGGNGRIEKVLRFTGAGADTLWFTADDVIACCPYGNVYAADGRTLEYRSYNAGPDGKHNTADDVLSSLSKYEYNAAGLLIYESNMQAGGDGVLDTADDTLSAYSTYTYDANGFQTSYTYYNHPGTDNTWKTPDDRTTDASYGWSEYTVDAFGNQSRTVSRTVGVDLMPRTTDDVIQGWYDQQFDSYGYMTRGLYYNGPGADSMWLTADDTIVQRVEYENDAEGLQNGALIYTDAGTDGMWLTADDVATYRQNIVYGPTRQAIESTTYNGAGPDAMWGTADDSISSYGRTAYDTNGNRIDLKSFTAGPDGMFGTPDDRVTYDADFELAK